MAARTSKAGTTRDPNDLGVLAPTGYSRRRLRVVKRDVTR